jgi:VCBS repeat-containing protein
LLKGGLGSDIFFGVGILSSDAQRGNDEINGASYTNLNSTDFVSFAYPRASYNIKFLPTLTLSDGSVSVGFGAVVSALSGAGKDTIANWNFLHFSDKTIAESDVSHASLVAYGLWSLADAFGQLKSFIGLSQKISDPKLKAIGAWFDYADGVITALAQVATESDNDFKSAITVTLTQAANAVTMPFINQAKSILDERIDNIPMPDSWKAAAKAAVDNGANDLSADISLATVALVNRVAGFQHSFSTIDWSAQWQQWMNDVKQAISNTYKLFDSGDPQQEWDDPQLPTPQAPPLPLPPSIVIDGYLSGTTVFADANNNGVLDPGEVSTTTDQNGNFTLTGGSGHLVGFGGTDTSTNLPFKGTLSAPSGYNAITPLTTIVDDLQAVGIGSADQKVLAAFGLSPTLDLSTLDPIAAMQAGDTTGAAVYVAGAKVMDTVIGLATALAGLGGNEATAQQDAFSAIAAAVSNLGSGGIFDLDNTTTIAGLFTSIAQHQGINVSQFTNSVAGAIAASNAALDQKLQQDGAGDALLSDVSGVQKIIQANQPPHAVDDFATATTGIGGSASADAAHGVLANDSDPDGDTLVVTGFTGGSHGNLVLGADGAYSYTATDLTGPTGSHLHDVFTYGISDSHGGVASANLDITLNRAPTTVNDSGGVAKGATISGSVLRNDSDADGDAVQVTSVAGGDLGHSIAGKYGALSLNGDGTYNYVANKGALPSQIVAQDTFDYTVSDGHGGTSTSTLSMTVFNPGVSYTSGANTTLSGQADIKNVLDGSAGRDILRGGNTADVLIGGPGDTLTGGSGPDTFLFRPGFGANTIADFNVNNDTLQFDKSIFPLVSAIASFTTDSSAGAVITDGHGDSVTLAGVTAAQLAAHSSDFHLV